MTLNVPKAVIARYFTQTGSFGVNCVILTAARPILLATKCSPGSLVFSNISLMGIFAKFARLQALTPSE